MKKLLGYVLKLTCAYLIAGVISRFVLDALYIRGLHCDELVRLCSKLFERPFVTLFGIW